MSQGILDIEKGPPLPQGFWLHFQLAEVAGRRPMRPAVTVTLTCIIGWQSATTDVRTPQFGEA